MSHSIRRFLTICVCALVQAVAWGQGDTKPLALVVPYPTGGVIDFVARQFRTPLEAALGRTVIVENIPGAAGTLGLQKMLYSTPTDPAMALGTDSDTLLAPLANPAVRFQPQDLRLIGLLARAPMFLAASPTVQASSLQALLVAARQASAEPLRFGNFGVDSSSHLIAVEFERLSGVRALHVPYKGIAPLIQDLMGGHIDFAFLPMAGSIPASIASGKLRALGIASSQPHPMHTEVPTIASAAGLSEFNFDSWSGVVVARNVPIADAKRLNTAVQLALGDANFRKAMSETGAAPASPMSMEDSERFFLQATNVARQLLTSSRALAPIRTDRP